jgi:hypothetical protein
MKSNEKLKRPKDHYSRTFLNKKKGSAHTIVQGAFEDWAFDGSALIADCNRHATIEFFSYNVKDYDQSLVKLQLLIAELQKLEQYMTDNRDYCVQLFSKKDKEDGNTKEESGG